jgi:hypothetical protein
MSRNSKSARNVARRKANTAARQSGGGPKQTAPKHGKKNAWWQVGNGTYAAFIKGKPKRGNAESGEAAEA